MYDEVFPIYYKKKRIGLLKIKKLMNGIYVQFTTAGLKKVLSLINAKYFNWIQICTKDDNPPISLSGEKTTIPYIDPLPGGFSLEYKPDYIYFSDTTPWYWDLKTIHINNKKGEYSPKSSLFANYTDYNLYFIDTPFVKKGCSIHFNTWLVSLDGSTKLKKGFKGFSWSVEKDLNGNITVDIDENSLQSFDINVLNSII